MPFDGNVWRRAMRTACDDKQVNVRFELRDVAGRSYPLQVAVMCKGDREPIEVVLEECFDDYIEMMKDRIISYISDDSC